MKIRKFKLPHISTVVLWKVIVYATILGLIIFFVSHEKKEYFAIRQQLVHANWLWLGVGILGTLLYVVLQGLMYVFSFRTIHCRISLASSMMLFLRRNLISVFLPAGGFSSLVFFTKNIEKQNISKTQIYLSSSIYAFCGLVSVAVIAIPLFIYLLAFRTVSKNELISLALLLLLIAAIGWAIYSLFKGTCLHKLIEKYSPKTLVLFQELKEQKFSLRHFIITNLISVCVDLIGIVHIFLAMLALGMNVSIEVALVAYIVMVIMLIVSPVLRGFGTIEISMTYIFIQYGYSSSMAIAVTLLFRFFEFWSVLILGVLSFITNPKNLLLRIAPSLLVFSSGVVNLVSVLTPNLENRTRILMDFLPLEALNTSHFLVLAAGVIMILLSVYLLRGLRNAWIGAVILSCISIVGNITKALDYEEAIFALMTLIILLYTYKSFYIRPDRRLVRIGYRTFIIGFACAMIYGVVGFYFLDKVHFNRDFSWKQSIQETFNIFFLFDIADLEPQTQFGQRFLYSIYTVGASSICLFVFTLVRPFVYRNKPESQEFDKANELIKNYGVSPLDFFKTYCDKRLFFTQDEQAFFAYKIANGFAIVLEEPVCNRLKNKIVAIHEFEHYCSINNLIPLYYRVSEKSLDLFSHLKRKILLIGQEATIDLTRFSLQGGAMKPIRNAINKMTESGFVVKIYEAPLKDGLLQKLKFVSDQWIKEFEKSESYFSQGGFDWQLIKNQTVLTVENSEEKIFAFMNLLPFYNQNEATYDLQRKVVDAPNGCLDFLMVKMIEYLKEKGIVKLNLGLAPMAGLEESEKFTEKTIKYAYENIRQFAHYKGLRNYKDKFSPLWENKYLVYKNDYELLQIPLALSKVMKL